MIRTMGHVRREATPHTEWCARDHRCGANEHRSEETIADRAGGRAVLTRVRAGNREYVEVLARIPLHTTETGARWQIGTALQLLREMFAAVAVRQGVVNESPRRRVLVDPLTAVGTAVHSTAGRFSR